MGLIEKFFTMLFGSGRNVVVETAEVFRENTEAGAAREAALQNHALRQHGSEFRAQGRGRFDRFMDAVNRLPRPMLALGTLGLFIVAMIDPVWFASRMQGLALVPEPLWWLLGAIVSFYFGARHQFKGQEFQRSIAQTMARTPAVVDNIDRLQNLNPIQPQLAATRGDLALSDFATKPDANPALSAWRAG
ncbi:MAG: carboxylesterase [Rhodobacterales bacterium]|nr:MAG: carboxylesterase [Rhodobacterales bacterium]